MVAFGAKLVDVKRITGYGLFLLAATFLAAATAPSWKTKPIAQWNNEDAKQVLSESPWAGSAVLQPIPDRSPSERRDSGDWDAGVGQGVGIAGTGVLGPRRMREAIEGAHYKPSPGNVMVRWASALPIRTAESKLGLTPATNLHTDWYAIVIYDVPLPDHRWSGGKLKGLAYLRRDNKPDIKPSRVDVVRGDEGMATVTYLFPRSEEIGRKDRSIVFGAQLDRLFVALEFYPAAMQIAGQLEL
jgi:hypothetical protein